MERSLSQKELFEYAEGRLAGREVPVHILQHLASDKSARAEVESISESLEFLRTIDDLEPSTEFVNQILIATRRQRRIDEQRRRRRGLALAIAKGMGYAACLVLAAGLCFGAASEPQVALSGASRQAVAVKRLAVAQPTSGDLARKTSEIRTLATAMRSRPDAVLSHAAREQRRTVHALETELSEAISALERHPGNPRANMLVQANVERTAQVLRSLYTEQNL